jgi:NTP pyrophosphatase (non-canonical NTP hydrolase)
MTQQSEAKKKNIYQKLQTIFDLVDVMQKTKSGFNYTYVPEEEILVKITAGLQQEKLQVYPSIVPGTIKVLAQDYEKVKNTNKETMIRQPVHENVVYGDMLFTWVNIENPEERIEVPWVFIGQQLDSSQALGSGLSYCTRYFYLKYFHVATTQDDPDMWRSKQSEVTDKQNAEITAEVLGELTDVISEYMKKHDSSQEVKTEITELISKHNEGKANYMKITDLDKARDLLEKVKKHTENQTKKENK